MSGLARSQEPHALEKTLLVTQGVLLIALLAVAPFAMQFTPFGDIYEEGVWQAQHSADPLYQRRAALVILGLVAGALGTLCFVAVVALRRCRQHVAFSFGLALAALIVGWRMYPYWVTGVFSAMRGLSSCTSTFDPKALIPMSWWGGDLWGLTVLMLYPVSIAGVPTLFVQAVIELRRKAWARAATIGFCVGVTILAYTFSPYYLCWLLD